MTAHWDVARIQGWGLPVPASCCMTLHHQPVRGLLLGQLVAASGLHHARSFHHCRHTGCLGLLAVQCGVLQQLPEPLSLHCCLSASIMLHFDASQ